MEYSNYFAAKVLLFFHIHKFFFKICKRVLYAITCTSWQKYIYVKYYFILLLSIKTKSLEGITLQGSESGGYLLSHNKCSTIGVAELNDPVRNGKGWDLSAITT